MLKKTSLPQRDRQLPKFLRDRMTTKERLGEHRECSLLARLNGIPIWRLAAATLLLPTLAYVLYQSTRSAIVIEPFSVPAGFVKRGLTPEAFARRVADTLSQIQATTDTRLSGEFLVPALPESSPVDVEIPGTKVGLRTVIEITRTVFGNAPIHVSGEVLERLYEESPNAAETVEVTIHLSQGTGRIRSVTFNTPSAKGDELVQRAAYAVLSKLNPLELSAYLEQHKNPRDAMAVAQGVLDDPSSNPVHKQTAFLLMGAALMELRRYDEAITQFRHALQLKPGDLIAVSDWGAALMLEGDFPAAYKKYAEAIATKDPSSYAALNGYGVALQRQKKYPEAQAKYREAVKANPKRSFPYTNWGILLSELKQYPQAAEKFEQAIRANPNSAGAYVAWANMLSTEGYHEAAAHKYEEAIAVDPRSYAAYGGWGDELAALARYADAADKYAFAAEIAPDEPAVYSQWALALQQMGQTGAALEMYRKALDLNPKSAMVHNNLGFLLGSMRQYDFALAEYEEALRLDAKFGYAYSNRAVALAAKKDLGGAVANFDMAIRRDPDNAYAYEQWCAVLVEEHQFKSAVELCQHALTLDGTRTQAYDELGVALAGLSNFGAAAQAFENAVAHDPKAAKVYEDWGSMLCRQRLPVEAHSKFARAREIAAVLAPAAQQTNVLSVELC
jgi:tetratricopeptide (TPR) repeat protein